MPTGGGKSLCYQLPAVVSRQTVVVISPLISLMQDQVMQLRQMEIPAAFVNSAIPSSEQHEVIRQAQQGAFRLLYLSPERLAQPATVAWLKRVPVALFAIDEAHCISEWGHEFRPEYRQLSSLRVNFPDKPIAAFTASATKRVRHDILAQLQLREPDKYIASFYRPNLRYLVKRCEDAAQQEQLLVSALHAHAGENVIIYAPTIKRVEETADLVQEMGFPAVPYHGQMDAGTRKRNQERWMSDEVRVLVGTIAFGLGINKPGVRAVIHVSLPKSVEQYYQEAGRAGRDGLPADCALLWRKKDLGLLAFFIDAIGDHAEQRRAWDRYNEILRFAEAGVCRHRQICQHFGETPKWTSCGMCDVCAPPPDWLTRKQLAASPGLKAKQSSPPAKHPVSNVDPDLLAYMREWRRGISVRANIAAFLVLHDSGLEDLCRKQPRNRRELLNVSGIGEGKAKTYGPAMLAALEAFREGARVTKRSEEAESPAEVTIRLLNEGRSFEEIARIRDRRLDGVIDYVAGLVEHRLIEFNEAWIPEPKRILIAAAITSLGTSHAKTLKDALPQDVTYGEIRLMAAQLQPQKRVNMSGAIANVLDLLREGRTFEEIAQTRACSLQTVMEHAANLVEHGHIEFEAQWVDAGKLRQIEDAIRQVGCDRLSPIKAALPAEVSFNDIRLVVARWKRACTMT